MCGYHRGAVSVLWPCSRCCLRRPRSRSDTTGGRKCASRAMKESRKTTPLRCTVHGAIFSRLQQRLAVAAAGMNFLSASPATAQPGLGPPEDIGAPRRRYVIRGGYVMSMDPAVGDFAPGDVLVEGTKILAVGPNLKPGHGAGVIDATGRIVMPGFIDTHHHQFETALRSFLANGILINDGSVSNDGSPTPSANPNYFVYILLTFAPVYRPEDVYISELFGGLAQLDDGVTRMQDGSQIHHSPAHS